MVNVADIDAYVDTVINARTIKAPHMLPPLYEEYNPGLDPNTPDEDVIIEVDKIKVHFYNRKCEYQSFYWFQTDFRHDKWTVLTDGL